MKALCKLRGMLVIMEADPSDGTGKCFDCGCTQFREHEGWIECEDCDFAVLKTDWQRICELED